MGSLLLTLVVVGLGMGVLLAVVAFFFQGYFYTEPNPGIVWQAPATAAGLTLFLLFWCWLNAASPGADAMNIPYNTLFAFHADVDMYPEPVKKLWSVKKGKTDPIEYKLLKAPSAKLGINEIKYIEAKYGDRLWNPDDVEAVLLEYQNEKIRFEPVKNVEEGGELEFVSKEGWRMNVYSRMITGQPTKSSWGFFLGVVLLNFIHFALWFVGLWLVLRFQWSHALLLALCLWLVATFTIAPVLLRQAANLAPPAPATQAVLSCRWLMC